MAKRPWILPADVKAYSEFPKVQARTVEKLTYDIVRAEQYIIGKTNNKFTDDEVYPTIPDNVKLAVILVAEFYANTAAEDPTKYQSETFDDYSYTRSESNSKELSVDDLDLEALLADYVIESSKVPVMMKLRKL